MCVASNKLVLLSYAIEVQKWLDDSEQGCIYFTFGSMTRIETFPEHIVNAFYKSFANISPVRVLMKVAKPQELPRGLPANVMTQSWFDQIQVLKHPNIRGFITHGGLMSTQESIFYGVPMIGIPLFGDQHFNVATYVKRNIAIKIDVRDISEKTMTDALHKILRDSLYKKAVKRVSREFKDHLETPINTAIYWTEYIARHGKNSLRLPASDLLWWQNSLWDIYSFLITILIVLVYISYILISIAYRMLWLQRDHTSSPRRRKNE
ncbi:hypothetical protein QAD02_014979 [Eretmocerus hayati]|uniref:Uncharacterized protein n=1 Tax=Eretmocerus hayati TaxID=131215 RepID=A0ACC2P7D6_9HYME|nr:hypothetical protein QAD02_014979 [Eretmocerus hayati]